MQQVRKVLLSAQTRVRDVGNPDNYYPEVCASTRKHYVLVSYDIFCTYVRDVSVKIQ